MVNMTDKKDRDTINGIWDLWEQIEIEAKKIMTDPNFEGTIKGIRRVLFGSLSVAHSTKNVYWTEYKKY